MNRLMQLTTGALLATGLGLQAPAAQADRFSIFYSIGDDYPAYSHYEPVYRSYGRACDIYPRARVHINNYYTDRHHGHKRHHDRDRHHGHRKHYREERHHRRHDHDHTRYDDNDRRHRANSARRIAIRAVD